MCCQLLRDSDATSMANSLELRMPFVDREIIEFSRTCADEHKLDERDHRPKRVLFEALSDLLPAELRVRKKRGFSLPLDEWMKGPLGSIIEDTCSRETVVRRGLLDPDVVEVALSIEGGSRQYPDRWTLMMLELWMREVLDAPAALHETIRAPVAPTDQVDARSAISG
jgi:asparagine synthase (glutamine-hydrolysing)